MSQPAKCAHCGEPLVIVLELDDRPILDRLQRVEQQLHSLNEQGERIMAAQDDINAAVAAIGAVVTDLSAAAANIQAEIAALGTSVDTSALDAAVASLQGVQASVDALETPAAPPADGGDAPAE